MTIDYEIQNLLPALSKEQLELLEKDIIKNGCLQPIIVWNGTIIDGHNRYGICKRNNIPFDLKEMQFENKEEAMIWAWTTQKARRNIDEGTLFNIAKVFKPYYEKKAREKQIEAGKNFGKGFIKCEKAIEEQKKEPLNTTKELADIAGTSQSTMNKVIQVQKHAPEVVNKAVENNVISINKGYEITKKLREVPDNEKEQKGNELIEQYINKGFKEIENKKAIELNYHNALFKILKLDVKEEEANIWINSMMECEKERLEEDIDEAIGKLEELKEIYKKRNQVRRVK